MFIRIPAFLERLSTRSTEPISVWEGIKEDSASEDDDDDYEDEH